MGNFHCGEETGKRFSHVHLHCNVSDLRIASKMSTLHPLEKFLQTPMRLLQPFQQAFMYGKTRLS